MSDPVDPTADRSPGPWGPAHPLVAASAAISAALSSVDQVDPAFMSTSEKAQALLELSAVIDRVEELRIRVLAHADDVADAEGARDAAAWLAHRGRRDRGECRHRLRLAHALAAHDTVTAGLRAGRVNLAQAEVVTRALDAPPDELTTEVRRTAEARLVEETARFAPRQLRILGRRVLEVVAPEVAEGLEQRLLEEEERRAARRAGVRSIRHGDGTWEIRIHASERAHHRLMTYLEAFTSPRRSAGTASGAAAGPHGPTEDRRPYDQRLGSAFEAFLEAVDPQRLPLHGGDATTVMVTIDLTTLLDDLGERGGIALVGDQPVTAAHARRLACTAGIIPVVLGGRSQVLDAGRTRRLYGPAQRRALVLQ